MNKVYIHGCSCGGNSIKLAKVRKENGDIVVYNTRRDAPRLIEQLEYLNNAGMGNSPLSIVVLDNNLVKLLSEY